VVVGTPNYWASTNGGSSWNVFAGQYGGQSSFGFTPTAAGTYRFHLRNQTACGFCWDSGNNGCPTYPYVDVVVNPRPIDGTISASATSICLGQSVTISSSGRVGTPNYWASTNGGQVSWDVFAQQYIGQYSFTYTPASVGTYRFHLRNNTACGFCWDGGNNGCPTYSYVDVVVGGMPSTYISGTTSIRYGGYTSLTAYPSGGTYYWSNGQSSQTINAYGGYYSVTVYLNGCQASSGIYVEEVNCQPDPPCTGPNCPCFEINCARMAAPEADEPLTDADGDPNVKEVTVFPNPATKLITVSLPEKLKEEKPVYLYDMMGRAVISSKISEGKWKVQLALENVPAGMYLVKVGYGDYGIVKKVMVVD
jgi:Secretion system C-terminal sorting domain